MSKIYCIGETVYDIIFKNGQPVAAKAGGSMLNSSVSMGRMHLPVHFISEYAADNIGDNIDASLKSANINTQYVFRYADGKTSIAIAFLNEKNDASYTFYKQLPEKRLDIAFPNVQAGDIVLFGSFYSINEDIRSIVKSFIEKAKAAGALIIYDPNYRKAHLHELNALKPMILENMALASLVRGSNEDFEMIFGVQSFEDAYNKVSEFCKILVYTENSKGVHVKTPNLQTYSKTRSIIPVSTIGAGDNFNTGIITGLYKYGIDNGHLNDLSIEQWQQLLLIGIDFASEVCMSYENYISSDFANRYQW